MLETIKFNNQSVRLELSSEADISVMREIFKLREYRGSEEIITSAVDPILDVGAHVGFFTVYARLLNPKVKIFALEPENNNLKNLENHLKINKIKDVKVITGALAGTTGTRYLKISEDSHNHYLLDKSDKIGKKVFTWNLSDFCKENKITRISLIKMDIEGGEYEIFRNLEAPDFLFFKSIILEYHNGVNGTVKDLEKTLREHGFGVSVFPSHFDKTMGFIFATNKRLK